MLDPQEIAREKILVLCDLSIFDLVLCMDLYLGVTDKKWFDYLSAIQPDEVNFWKPGSGSTFKAIPEGAPFLFKLHAPFNKIAGGGFFVKYFQLPLSVAWETFGVKNGAPDYWQFRDSILKYRRGSAEPNPTIGCTILASPFFLPENQWLDCPEDWAPSIVQGKKYSTEASLGSELWQWAFQHFVPEETQPGDWVQEDQAAYGKPTLIRPRLGQGSFRLLVTDAYHRRCAISGERTLPALEAAHIKPYPRSGPHRVNNGLLLRADLHKLFDSGLLTVTNDQNVHVSRRIKDEYENGKEYYRFHGKTLIACPDAESEQPSKHYLEWHQQNVFRE